MTTLYRPVLIESAEQAAALPGKAVILVALKRTGEVHASHLHEDLTPDYWPDRLEEPRRWDWTALVPVEAEEEWGERAIAEGEFISVARYVTPWEEA